MLFVLFGISMSAPDNRRNLFADNSVMTINMPDGNNWDIGWTLDAMMRSGKPSPFSDESMEKFAARWDDADFQSQGKYKMTSKLIEDQEQRIQSLDIESTLKVSYLMFSGDAHMKFAKETEFSSNDVSVMVKATKSGKKKSLSLSDTNLLELREKARDYGDLDAFEEEYGGYLIIGFMYGGEILFESVLSARSEREKKEVKTGLSVSYKQA